MARKKPMKMFKYVVDPKGEKKVSVTNATSRIVKANKTQLREFNVDELRAYAKSLGVRTGANKEEIVFNLVRSGKATLQASLRN